VAIAIVGGAIANKPHNGGEAWVRLSWILGLRRLGFDVYFAEVLGDAACVDADGRRAPFRRSVNRTHFERVVTEFGLQDRVALLDERGDSLYGLNARALTEAMGAAEVLFDLSGHLGELVPAGLAACRVYVDLDPGFTQTWHVDPSLGFSLSGYDRYVTVGLNVGDGGCAVPAAGLQWVATLPPVPIEEWASEPLLDPPYRFTTVARWRSHHGPIELDGRTLGLKHHEFRRLIDLPGRVPAARLELAVDIDQADMRDFRALRDHGWGLVDPREVAGTPGAFRDYVRGSHAEISVAQPAFVQSRSGWFSDRTAAFLAAGRPALVQDTGVRSLPIGEGLLTFSSPQEAVAGVGRIERDPLGHCEAARALAESRLDSDRVLGVLLEKLEVGG
jgi:hypothetical protein